MVRWHLLLPALFTSDGRAISTLRSSYVGLARTSLQLPMLMPGIYVITTKDGVPPRSQYILVVDGTMH